MVAGFKPEVSYSVAPGNKTFPPPATKNLPLLISTDPVAVKTALAPVAISCAPPFKLNCPEIVDGLVILNVPPVTLSASVAVSDLITISPELEVTVTWALGRSIITSSSGPGTTPPLQFEATAQSPLEFEFQLISAALAEDTQRNSDHN